jgi:hypothetical protein
MFCFLSADGGKTYQDSPLMSSIVDAPSHDLHVIQLITALSNYSGGKLPIFDINSFIFWQKSPISSHFWGFLAWTEMS